MRSVSALGGCVMSGGSSTICRRPSRSVVNRGSAWSLVLDRACLVARAISVRNDLSETLRAAFLRPAARRNATTVAHWP